MTDPVDTLHRLAEEAERDNPPLAVILFTVCGALLHGPEALHLLAERVVDVNRSLAQFIRAQGN